MFNGDGRPGGVVDLPVKLLWGVIMIIKNDELLTELIKKDLISLKDIELWNVIVSETGSRTLKDFKKVLEYMNWYTKKTQKQGHFGWTFELTLQEYHRYLKNFERVPSKNAFPTEDIYVLNQFMEDKKRDVEDEIWDSLNKKVHEEYDKQRHAMSWERIKV